MPVSPAAADVEKRATSRNSHLQIVQRKRYVERRRHVERKRHRANHAAVSGQIGMASYYRHGQRVASGGRFDPKAMTAAHKTLPFGTRVRVTHLGNGRSVDVHINDRGPYIAGRIIDLTAAAAGVIGMTGSGVARISMTVLGK
jgi:rare lipoprotein A